MNYIGVDLGGTNIVVGLVDEEGKMIKSISRPTVKERGVEPIFDDIFDMCNELITEFDLNKTNLNGIGIGILEQLMIKMELLYIQIILE